LLLNISPKADGSIPQEQKDMLLAMGDWLKKYGEAIYATRAWEKYGEGPTKMGAAHGVFTAPAQGTAQDVRYTRSKDNTSLYAILLGWDAGQKEVILHSFSSDRFDIKSLKEVSFINGAAGQYLPLKYKQDASGLTINLPEQHQEELAYVMKLAFNAAVPELNKYVDLNCSPYYYLTPAENTLFALGANGKLSDDRKNQAQQWKIEKSGIGIYKIVNRGHPKLALECSGTEEAGLNVQTELYTGNDNQQWKIEESFNGLLKITNKQHAAFLLTINGDKVNGAKVSVMNKGETPIQGWKLLEVCDLKQTSFKKLTIPGTIEAEDFDLGCPGDTYYDKDEINAGGKYRPNEGVDIEVCAAGGYNIGWVNSGEWMAYTVNVAKNGNYKLSIFVATVSDAGKLHIEFDDTNKTGIMPVMNTGGFQSWKTLSKTVQLTAGKQIMKIFIDEASSGVNLDKISFTAEF